MNKKANKQVANFFQSISVYMKKEYKPKYYRFYNDPVVIDEMIRLTSSYYWGGNTVPSSAGDLIDYMRSKYDI